MAPKTDRRRTTSSKSHSKSTADECYYSILQIPKDAEETEIRKAYKKLAMRWHPDKNRTDPDKATEMFKLVAEAFEVLSDPEKREIYDKYGKDGLKNGVSSRNFNGFEFDFNDAASIFERFFGHSSASNDFFSSAFNDPFFPTMQPNISRGSSRGNAMNQDPFMSMSGFGNFGGNGMGVNMGGFGFDFGSNFGAGNGGFESVESFSSGGGNAGVSKSTRSSTRIVNGKKVTKTETTVRYADGHVETVANETSEDVGSGRIGNGNNAHGNSSKSRLGWF